MLKASPERPRPLPTGLPLRNFPTSLAYGSQPLAAEEDAPRPLRRPILPLDAVTLLLRADARPPLQALDALVEAEDLP
jgi:hypothetical protein